jgi:hypothetical protein
MARNPVVRLLRLALRTKVSFAAGMSVAGAGAGPVVVLDLSRYGALVAGTFAVSPGAPVEMLWPDGTTSGAEVRWTSAGRAGLEFSEPLADIAPLIAFSGIAPPAATPGRDVGGRRRSPPAGLAELPGGPSRMMERACRKQGFAWLAGDDLGVAPVRGAGDASPPGVTGDDDSDVATPAPVRRSIG